MPLKEGSKRKKPLVKAPKIQRLITPERLQRKRKRIADKRKRTVKRRDQAAEYARLLAQRQKEARIAKEEAKKRRRTTSRSNTISKA